MMSLTPKITCTVVDVSEEERDVQFNWYVGNTEVHTAQTQTHEEQHNSTLRVVSTLPIKHNDWMTGKMFKCKVSNKALPGPVERTISKPKGGSCRQTGWGCAEHKNRHLCGQPSTVAMTSVCTSNPIGPVQAPQVYTFAVPTEQNKKMVTLTCLVMGFLPEDIDVEWESNGQQETNYKNTPPVFDTDGSYFLYSKLNVEKSRWDRGDTFSCAVLHEALHNRHTTKTISRSLGK